MRFFGGESKFVSRAAVALKFRLGWAAAAGIGFVRGADESSWKRDLRLVDSRGGRVWGVGWGGLEGGGAGLDGLRMLENHFWTADAGDTSDATAGPPMHSELFRLCLADFERISQLKPSTTLCLCLNYIKIHVFLI